MISSPPGGLSAHWTWVILASFCPGMKSHGRVTSCPTYPVTADGTLTSCESRTDEKKKRSCCVFSFMIYQTKSKVTAFMSICNFQHMLPFIRLLSLKAPHFFVQTWYSSSVTARYSVYIYQSTALQFRGTCTWPVYLSFKFTPISDSWVTPKRNILHAEHTSNLHILKPEHFQDIFPSNTFTLSTISNAGFSLVKEFL